MFFVKFCFRASWARSFASEVSGWIWFNTKVVALEKDDFLSRTLSEFSTTGGASVASAAAAADSSTLSENDWEFSSDAADMSSDAADISALSAVSDSSDLLVNDKEFGRAAADIFWREGLAVAAVVGRETACVAAAVVIAADDRLSAEFNKLSGSEIGVEERPDVKPAADDAVDAAAADNLSSMEELTADGRFIRAVSADSPAFGRAAEDRLAAADDPLAVVAVAVEEIVAVAAAAVVALLLMFLL